MGNHDKEGGAEIVDSNADMLMKYTNCIFEKKPSVLGSGNYVIAIEKTESPSPLLL